MDFTKLKNLAPHAIAVLLFITLTCIYFYPQLEGFQLRQGDTEQHIGMSKEISDFRIGKTVCYNYKVSIVSSFQN